MAQTISGTVTFFNNGKNYGRIQGEDGQEYHVGLSQIRPSRRGFMTLAKGEVVKFEPQPRFGNHKLPEARKVERSVELPLLSEPPPNFRSTKATEMVQILIADDRALLIPAVEKSHNRDYGRDNIQACYIGHPGYTQDIRIEVITKVQNPNKKVVLVDDAGGVQKSINMSAFPLGGFALIIAVNDQKVNYRAMKLFVRRQDSMSSVDPYDFGVWVVIQESYNMNLDMPAEYADERDLAVKLEAQIPDPYGWGKKHRQASAQKFGPGIAKGVLKILDPTPEPPKESMPNNPFEMLAKS